MNDLEKRLIALEKLVGKKVKRIESLEGWKQRHIDADDDRFNALESQLAFTEDNIPLTKYLSFMFNQDAEKIKALEDVLVHTDSGGNRIPLKQANKLKQFNNRLELYTKANNDLWGQSKTRIEELEAKLNALIKTHNALNIPRVLGNLADSIVKIKQRLEALEKHHDDSKIYEHKKDIDKLYEEPTKKPEHDCENCKKLSSCVDIEVQRGDWGNCLEYEPIATAEQTMCLNWNYAKNSASHRCVSQGFKPSEYVLKSEVVQRIYKLKEKYNSVGVLKILLKELSEK